MATPAQIANDMAAQAAYWHGRDRRLGVAVACSDAAQQIRAHLAGERVDGRTWGGLHRRLLNLENHTFCRSHHIDQNLTRARLALEELRREADRK